MRRKDVNMLEGSIVKGLLAMALPIMLANVIQSMYNIIDMRVLKQFDPGDGLAIGAVSACSNLTNLITSLVIGVSTGSNVIVARYIGRKDPESRDRAMHTALAFSIMAGIVLMVIGIIGAPLPHLDQLRSRAFAPSNPLLPNVFFRCGCLVPA